MACMDCAMLSPSLGGTASCSLSSSSTNLILLAGMLMGTDVAKRDTSSAGGSGSGSEGCVSSSLLTSSIVGASCASSSPICSSSANTSDPSSSSRTVVVVRGGLLSFIALSLMLIFGGLCRYTTGPNLTDWAGLSPPSLGLLVAGLGIPVLPAAEIPPLGGFCSAAPLEVAVETGAGAGDGVAGASDWLDVTVDGGGAGGASIWLDVGVVNSLVIGDWLGVTCNESTSLVSCTGVCWIFNLCSSSFLMVRYVMILSFFALAWYSFSSSSCSRVYCLIRSSVACCSAFIESRITVSSSARIGPNSPLSASAGKRSIKLA
eukprot:comp17824_c0_seq1/m.17948 comp17824_c0_seq1/g.17948  ORF comp17824_c0_seq1/g.17948 comp17824_c0_seq1/m.17948 type:complete len:318 (+) comp17824_c0_seq1:656-1609(+)